MARRDTFDTERSADPLLRADDAVLIDTTERTIDEIVAELLEKL